MQIAEILEKTGQTETMVEFDHVRELAIETGRIIGGLRSSLKKC